MFKYGHQSIDQLLNFKNNKITDDGVKKILEEVKRLRDYLDWDYVGMDLTNNPITFQSIKAIAESEQINKIQLADFVLNDEAARLIANSRMLNLIYLKSTHLTPKGALLLASKINLSEFSILDNANAITHEVIKALNKQTKLKVIAFNNITLSKEDMELLVQHPLEKLELTNVTLQKGALEFLRNAKIKTLSLNNMQLNDKDMEIFAENSSIQSLTLKYNDIHLAGVKIIATMPKLWLINLEGNRIGVKAVIILGQLKKTLILRLPNIGFTSQDAIAFIKSNPKNERLDLSDNPIGDEALPYLLNDYYMAKMRVLRIKNLKITDKGFEKLKHATSHDGGWLELSGNHITAKGLKALINSLDEQSMQNIIIDNNDIGDEGLKALSNAKFCLFNVNIRNNHLSKAAVEDFITHLSGCVSPQSVIWRDESINQ